MMMYFVSYHDVNGDDMSGFVSATTADEAAALWFKWWFNTFRMGDQSDPDRQCTVYAIPACTSRPRFLEWHDEVACQGRYVLNALYHDQIADRLMVLTAEYEAYAEAQDLDLGSCDEMLIERIDRQGKAITPAQKEWLNAFLIRWEEAEHADL